MSSGACQICGTNRDLDRHHVIPRKIGGTRNPNVLNADNILILCRACHSNIHNHRWEIERSQTSIRVFDCESGEQIMRRQSAKDYDSSSVFASLNHAEQSLLELLGGVSYLSDDELVEAFRYATAFGKRAWLAQASILFEAQQRSVYGEQTLLAISRRFEISRSQAYKYALVWKVFFSGNPESEVLNIETIALDEPSWYVVAASETEDPEGWLAYAQDRKAEEPSYSVSRLRQDIIMARWIAGVTKSREATGIEQNPLGNGSWACPWVRIVCMESGKTVQLSDCQQCEHNHFDRGDLSEPRRKKAHDKLRGKADEILSGKNLQTTGKVPEE